MKHWKRNTGIVLGVLVLVGLYYYISLPAINIHASGFWVLVLVLLGVLLAEVLVKTAVEPGKKVGFGVLAKAKEKKSVKLVLGLFAAVLLVYLIGAVLSSPIVNARKYQKLLEPENRDFTEDIKEVNYNQIPLLDKDSAELLGNRKMGSMVDMVSQFEVSSIYSQINVNGRPVRVTPLVYASPIKWLTNQKQGIPAYITIDMATQNTEIGRAHV